MDYYILKEIINEIINAFLVIIYLQKHFIRKLGKNTYPKSF
jgi:hypothetical protein